MSEMQWALNDLAVIFLKDEVSLGTSWLRSLPRHR